MKKLVLFLLIFFSFPFFAKSADMQLVLSKTAVFSGTTGTLELPKGYYLLISPTLISPTLDNLQVDEISVLNGVQTTIVNIMQFNLSQGLVPNVTTSITASFYCPNICLFTWNLAATETFSLYSTIEDRNIVNISLTGTCLHNALRTFLSLNHAQQNLYAFNLSSNDPTALKIFPIIGGIDIQLEGVIGTYNFKGDTHTAITAFPQSTTTWNVQCTSGETTNDYNMTVTIGNTK